MYCGKCDAYIPELSNVQSCLQCGASIQDAYHERKKDEADQPVAGKGMSVEIQPKVLVKKKFDLYSAMGMPETDPKKSYKAVVSMCFTLAYINIVTGLLIEFFKVQFLLDIGMGFYTYVCGIVFLLLSFRVSNGSRAALATFVFLMAVDGVVWAVNSQNLAGSSGVASGVNVGRVMIIFFLSRGFRDLGRLGKSAAKEPPQRPGVFSLIAALSSVALVGLPYLLMFIGRGRPVDWNLVTDTCSFAGFGACIAAIYKGFKAFPKGGAQRALGILGIFISLAAIYVHLAVVFMTYRPPQA